MTNLVKARELKKELDFLYRVAQSVHSLEIDELLEEIVDIAIKVTRGDSCLVYLFDRDSNGLVLRASKNPHPDLLKNIIIKVGEGITGWVAKEKKPVILANGASKDPRFKFFRNLPEDKFEAFISVPILTRKGIAGVINVQHKKKHSHSTMEINFMTAAGKMVGGAVENALLVEESLALKEALEIRKLIEKAKGIIMSKKRIGEAQAYRIIQKESMDKRKSLKEVAEAVIMAEEMGLSY